MAEKELTTPSDIAQRPIVRLILTSGLGTGLRFAGAGCGLLAYVLLAHLLDPGDLGTVFLATSLATIGASLFCFGIPGLLTRIFARYKARNRIASAWLIFKSARRTALLVCFGAIAIALLAISVMAGGARFLLPTLIAGAALVPAIVLLRLNGALAFAFRRPITGYMPDSFARPALLLLAASALFVADAAPNVATVLAVIAAIAWATVVVQAYQLRALRPPEDADARPPKAGIRLFKAWQRAGIMLLPANIVLSLFADAVILIAALALADSDIAILGIALRLTFLAGFVIQVLMQVVLPDMADATATGNRRSLVDTVRKATALCFVASVAAFVFFWLGGKTILGIFGPEFVAGYDCLIVLALAQIARVPGAVATHYLTLTGRQRDVSLVMGAALVVLAVCSIAAAEPLGLIGVGLAVLATQLFISAVLCVLIFGYDRMPLVGRVVRRYFLEPMQSKS